MTSVGKSQPSPAGVHVSSTGGSEAMAGQKKRKAKTFAEIKTERAAKSAAPGIPHPHVGNRTGRMPRRRSTGQSGLGREIETREFGAPGARRPNPFGKSMALHENGDGTAKSPFMYDPNALGSLRPDQVPRFFGALTNPENCPLQTVDLNNLIAMQDRVDTAKVQAIRSGSGTKPAVVVRHNGREYIADGHHRLTADALDGKTEATVRYKDLEERSQALKRDGEGKAEYSSFVKAEHVLPSLGIVLGWAIVCKQDGRDYWDVQKNHIPEDAMFEAAADFMEHSRLGNEMHAGPDRGVYVFAFPLTTEIAKAMGITTRQTGLMIGYKPPPDVLAKFVCGEYTGFSIEGYHLETEMP